MFKKYLYLFTVLSILSLSGCATNAGFNQMTVQSPINQPIRNSALTNSIAVNQVSGGHETNPLWTSQIDNQDFQVALIQSLQATNLYHQLDGSKYTLNANLIKLQQPLIGFDFKVTCEVNYSLQDAVSKAVVYNKNITTSYTATMHDSLGAIARLKMATEGAAKANINELIHDLYNLPLTNQ